MPIWPREASPRRLKQHVHAVPHAWFATCLPGLERLLAGELERLGIEGVSSVAGGVEFTGRLEDMMRAHLQARLPGHLRLRLATFRAPNPAALRDRLESLPWDLWVGPEIGIRIEGGEGAAAAARRVLDDFAATFPGRRDDGSDQVVLVRCREGEWQVSLEASGEPLHKRGYRLETGRAPLRETMAAALLDLVEYRGAGMLVDPMAGSGTIALEAARLACGVPTGLDRGFAFECWPGHREATWQHLRRKAEEAIAASPAVRVVARDVSRRTLQGATANAGRSRVAPAVRFEQVDFLEALPPAPEAGWVVFNPPYGHRLAVAGGASPGMETIARRLVEAWAGWRIGLVTPDPAALVRGGLEIVHQIAVPHGGLEVSLVAARVPDRT